jgi:hypothetical protein
MYIGKNWYTEPEIKSLVKKLEAENAELKKQLKALKQDDEAKQKGGTNEQP